MKADFGLNGRKSKLAPSLKHILYDEKSDELSYFILFMDSADSANYVKFLLDLKNFESAFAKHETNSAEFITHNQSKSIFDAINLW